MATAEQEQLLAELWTVGMRVPDLVRKVRRRVPLRTVQAWARAPAGVRPLASSSSSRPRRPRRRARLRSVARQPAVCVEIDRQIASGDGSRTRDRVQEPMAAIIQPLLVVALIMAGSNFAHGARVTISNLKPRLSTTGVREHAFGVQ